ncbi:UNVERIFIED_CONTAM: hypothetical protein GTU68_035420 [Idotea baltica]|nr:hypothetical protein [Idotea baltica]
MKTLLIGKTGQLGQALRRELALQTQLILLNQQEVSIVNITCLQQYIRQLQPDTIINAAAYTLVDKAEQQPLLAYKINTHVPKILAIEARKLDALLIHYSTDYIFNGQKNKPYVEEDTPRPLNIYGHSKWLGERAIQEECSKYFILRTSWLYSTTGENFFLTLQKLLQQNYLFQVVRTK